MKNTRFLLQKDNIKTKVDFFQMDLFSNKDKNIQPDNVSHYFDSLNLDINHFVNSNDICTPMDCVKEMIDKIPTEFWFKKDLKILDPCCGNGNFHAYIQTKTGLQNLYFNDINKLRLEHVKKYFGSSIHISEKKFLEFEDTEKFDLIVADPPFAKFSTENKRVSKNHNLSRNFIKKAVQLTHDNGYILFIVPNNWMSYSDRNDLPLILTKYQFIHINIHGAKKYFPKVGSSFTWFLLQKKTNNTPFSIQNNYVIKDVQTIKIPVGVQFFPLYNATIVENILNKTLRNKNLKKYSIQTSSYLHRFTKKDFISDIQTTEFKYKLIHTHTQTVWSKKPHKFQQGFKVFISLTNQFNTFIDNCGMTQSVAFILCKNKVEATIIKKKLDNEIFIFLNNITRYGNFNNIRVLQQFPLLGEFKLTSKEELFIHNFNNTYYGKT